MTITTEQAISVLKACNPNTLIARTGNEEVYDVRETAFDMAIKALERSRWIPVKEKVPELYKTVLVTRFGDVIKARRTDLTRSGIVCWVTEPGGAYEKEEETNIKAWMPLPEPYRAESED